MTDPELPDAQRTDGQWTDEQWTNAQWTDEARRRYRQAAAELLVALSEHERQTSKMSGRQHELPEMFAANDALRLAAEAFDDALMDFTGTAIGWEVLADYEDEEFDDDVEVLDAPSSGVVALMRRDDYLVIEEEAVVEAGRQAYRATWPNDTDDDAKFRVHGLGPALYELIHAAGAEDPATVLARTEGLRPAGPSAVVFAMAAEEFDPDAIDLFGGDDAPTEIYRLVVIPGPD